MTIIYCCCLTLVLRLKIPRRMNQLRSTHLAVYKAKKRSRDDILCRGKIFPNMMAG